VNDLPLRVALQQTLQGLADQIPSYDPEYDAGFVGDDTRYEHLHWMIDQCLVNLMEWPTDKISRWIGFIQGVQVARGDMDSDKERDRTRPFFHKAYEAMGLKKPETVDRHSDGSIEGHQTIDDLFQKR